MNIIIVESKSRILENVIELGEKHTNTLGFFPRGAYEQKAEDNLIIAAVEGEQVLGYLLFGYNPRLQLASITHLCVEEAQRGKHISDKLFQELENQVKDKVCRIRVKCREDYKEATRLWPRLGFKRIRKIDGRKKTESKLLIWTKGPYLPDLLSSIQTSDDTVLNVCLDYNVIADACKPPSDDTIPSHALMEDWLTDMLFHVSPEFQTEVARDQNIERAKQLMKFVKESGFETTNALHKDFETIENQLKNLFGISPQDKSDLAHVAWCGASGIDFFVTNDERLINLSNQISDLTGLRIMTPSEIIVHSHSLISSSEYRSGRFSGSDIQTRRISNDDLREKKDLLVSEAKEGEKKYIKRLRKLLAQPKSIKTQLLRYNNETVAVISWEIRDQQKMIVHVIRVLHHSSSETISTGLIEFLIKKSVEKKVSCIRIEDEFRSISVFSACLKLGFLVDKNNLIRWTSNERLDIAGILIQLNNLKANNILPVSIVDTISQRIKRAKSPENSSMLLNAEKDLWPLKIKELNLPTYIVSIKPGYAMQLFDGGLSRNDLFGGDKHLLLNSENTYYRADRGRRLECPARLMWYVNKGDHSSGGIRAISYLNEVCTGDAKYLFRIFQSLGVFKWRDILKTIEGDESKKLMALVFSHSETLRRPVTRGELNRIWQSEGKKKFHVQQPLKIKENLFWKIYSLARGI